MKRKGKKLEKGNKRFEIFGFLILVLFIGFSAFFVLGKMKPQVAAVKQMQAEKKPEPYVCKDCVPRLIDGVSVEKGEEDIFPVAVMIENHVDARPQSGLAHANLVFEAEAEGGITRFLAIFADGENLKEIGPVRSARAYFINWAHEFSPLYVHCGGSPEALAKIIDDKILDFNEFYRGSYFWRDNKRFAPHNLFTSTELLEKYLDSKKIAQGNYLPWKFKDDLPIEKRPAAQDIKVSFRTSDFDVEWKYDKDMDDYVRYMAGKQHKDKNGEEIRAKNVVIMYVKSRVYDDHGRQEMDMIGSGKAVICLDGLCQDGAWKKNSETDRTRFYDKTNQEIKFNTGPTWIEVIKPEYKVEY